MSRPAARPEPLAPEAGAALADLSAVMQRAVARMQEKRTTVQRTVAAPAPQVGNTGAS